MDSTAERRERRFTADDYRALADGRRYQVIRGRLIEMTPAPSRWHQRTVLQLAALLHAHVGRQGGGEVNIAPFDVYLSREDVVQPDVVFVDSARAGGLKPDGMHGAPSLVVEVLSPGTRALDTRAKRALYERAGVLEVWLVDPDDDGAIEVCRLTEGKLVTVATIRGDERLETPLLPGFSVAAREVFPQP